MESKFVSPFLMWLLAGSGAIFSLVFLPAYCLLPSNTAFSYLLALIFIFWLGFLALAFWQNRQAAASAAATNRLITTGVYSLVRHPIYFADILLAWGIFLHFHSFNMLVAAAWITFVLFSWMDLEEKALLKKFGRKYADYAKKVPKFIPRI